MYFKEALVLTFKHLNSHCGHPRHPTKSYSCSFSNLTKSTFTNNFFYGNVMSWNFLRACLWMRRRVNTIWTITLCFSFILTGF